MGWIHIEKTVHDCQIPLEDETKELGYTAGSIWQCDECGQQWQFSTDYGNIYFFQRHGERVLIEPTISKPKYPMDPMTCGHMFEWYGVVPPTQCLKCGTHLAKPKTSGEYIPTLPNPWPVVVTTTSTKKTECDHFNKFIGIMIPQSGETGQVCENAKFPFCPKCGEKL